ncbi:MAG: MarR family winged helix-turn-helix transcriptional regulator [Acidimicrobiales bacterium]
MSLWKEEATVRCEDASRANGADGDPVTLVGLVFETATGLRRRLGQRLEHDHELPPQSFEVLIRLARTPGGVLRMSDLAAQTALTPSGLTRSVDRLEEAGLVRRLACEEDRRGSFAMLTDCGTEKMARALDCHRDELESLLEGTLSRSERAHLCSLLRRVRDRVNPNAARVSDA